MRFPDILQPTVLDVLWPQSLPLDYSGSIAIPAVKHALLITLQRNVEIYTSENK